MKTLVICILYALILNSNLKSQDEFVTIKEREGINICGQDLIVDKIWMNEGIIRADISMLEQPNSKPITGGYKKGDELQLSGSEGCTYYIASISKSGLDSGKGRVLLSKIAPAGFLQICEDSLFWEERGKYWFDTLDYRVTAIREGDDGVLMAEINTSYKSSSIAHLFLRENDVIWAGECLYKVTYLRGHIYNSMGKEWEIEPGKLVLTRQNYYTNSSNEYMYGLENQPGIKKYYVIRKATLYKGMKPTKEELENNGPQLWLLQVFFESRIGASRTMKIVKDGKEIIVQYDAVRTFKNDEEALEYAKENSITDVKLEEEK
jgi:hypothetical protein